MKKLHHFDVITIFPEMITGYASQSILGRAQKAGKIAVAAHDLRDWTTDKHRSVDDSPYGGGPGMVMKVEPFERAVRELKRSNGGTKKRRNTRVILTSASGKTFTQKDAKRLAKYDQLIFLCGRYEGIDARVEEHIADIRARQPPCGILQRAILFSRAHRARAARSRRSSRAQATPRR